MRSEVSNGMNYFLNVHDDHARPTDCVPNESTNFIDKELKIAEDANTLMLRELLKCDGSNDHHSLVSGIIILLIGASLVCFCQANNSSFCADGKEYQ